MATKENSGWMGWIGFAVILLTLSAVFHVITGFVALFNDKVFAVTPNNVWVLDYTQWGWLHVLAGILMLFAAGSLANGNMYGRIVAVLVAMASVVANMAFIPIYPIWSLLMIFLGVMVIWAVTVHGKELKQS